VDRESYEGQNLMMREKKAEFVVICCCLCEIVFLCASMLHVKYIVSKMTCCVWHQLRERLQLMQVEVQKRETAKREQIRNDKQVCRRLVRCLLQWRISQHLCWNWQSSTDYFYANILHHLTHVTVLMREFFHLICICLCHSCPLILYILDKIKHLRFILVRRCDPV